MFERFSERSRRVLVLAQQEARLLGHNFIGTEHILLGLLSEGDGVAAQALASLGISLSAVREKVEETIGTSTLSDTGSPPFTPRAKKVLELALRESLQLGHSYIGTEHMLLGLVSEGKGVAATVLQSLGGDLSRVRQQVLQQLSGHGGTGTQAAVRGDLVERTAIILGAAELIGWDDAEALLKAGPLLDHYRTERAVVDGVEYETCTYRPSTLPEVSVSVAGASVTREAFDDFTSRLPGDAVRVEGLADAATYSPSRRSLRVLCGSTLFVVKVSGHPKPRQVAVTAATRALERLASRQP